MDQRERFGDDEEALVAAIRGVLKHHHVVTVGLVAQASDGRTLVAQPAIKRRDVLQDGTVNFVDHPLLTDMPIHHPGGGGITHTFPMALGDEVIALIASRALDVWHQQGRTSAPMSTRTNSLSDGLAIPGLRSTPRQLEAISTTSAQIRSDDGHHVTDHDPLGGITHFSADPSTAIASADFNPFKQAATFFRHAIQGATGILGQAISGSTVHDHGITHADGPFMRAANALHSVLCHPINGSSLNAQNALHSITAGPLGAIMSAFGGKHTVSALASGLSLQSAAGIALQCPAGGLSLPGGSIGGGSLASGAAAQNVGTLTGDVSGTLPNVQVVALGNVDGRTLPAATSDATAAAAGVQPGGLYRNTAALAGASLLAVRMA